MPTHHTPAQVRSRLTHPSRFGQSPRTWSVTLAPGDTAPGLDRIIVGPAQVQYLRYEDGTVDVVATEMASTSPL